MPGTHAAQDLFPKESLLRLSRGRPKGVFPPAIMERQMSLISDDGEIFGSGVLNLAVIAGALFIMLAALWAPAMPTAPAVAQAQPIKQVVLVAHPSHAS